MINITGVSTQKNNQGEVTHVTFDMSEHKDTITPILEQLEVLEKQKFDKMRKEGTSVEELRKHMYQKIESLWTK
jgi:hypothetical protein